MQLDFEFETGNNKKYEVDGIRDSTVYTRESVGQLPRLYYLVLWKSYPKEENTWEPALAIEHFGRLVIVYHKDNPEKPIVTSAPVDTALLMPRPTAPPMPRPTADIPIKQKRGRLLRSTTTKRAKKS